MPTWGIYEEPEAARKRSFDLVFGSIGLWGGETVGCVFLRTRMVVKESYSYNTRRTGGSVRLHKQSTLIGKIPSVDAANIRYNLARGVDGTRGTAQH